MLSMPPSGSPLTVLSVLLALSCAPKAPPSAPPPPESAPVKPDASGKIGVRFRALEEGLLVVGVAPGMGAADAGIVPGDLIVAVDGQSLAGLPAGEARQRIMGPAGSAVVVMVQGPLGAAEREVRVVRRPLLDAPGGGKERQAPAQKPAVVRAFQAAMRRGSDAEVEAAVAALIAANFGDIRPSDAIASSLRVAVREDSERAALAVELLGDVEGVDWRYHRAIGETLSALGQHALAVQQLEQALAARPPDYQGLDGTTGDLGGGGKTRRLLIASAHAAGQEEKAAQLARALARTNDITSLLSLIGMAPLEAGEVWSAALPAVDDFTVELLTGESWSLEAQRGHPVLLTFWATWCGPCRKELPELEKMWQAHQGDGARFLAISIDNADSAEKIPEMIAALGVTFPVTHRPDLGRAFGVSGIPALRVLNQAGALHYSAKGYSEAGVARLEASLLSAMAAEDASQTELGPAWSALPAELVSFLPQRGTRGLWAGEAGIALGVEGAPPLLLEDLDSAPERDISSSAVGVDELLTWLDGPIASSPGGLLVRAWDAHGAPRWLLTVPSGVVDLAVDGERLWVATQEAVLVFSSDGALLEQHDLIVTDLASSTGGVWGVGGAQRWWLALGASPVDRGAAPEAARIDSEGGVVTALADAVIRGRFGPDGARRTVIAREDGTLIGLDGSGAPAFTWKLGQTAQLAARDLNGDGADELLVAIRRQGLAAVALSLP